MSATHGLCTKCGESNPYTAVICKSCGSRLPWSAGAATAQKMSSRGVVVMNCPKCGYAMDAIDSDCPRCRLNASSGASAKTGTLQPDKVDKLLEKSKAILHAPLLPTKPPVPQVDDSALPPVEDGWYYAYKGQRLGPISGADVIKQIKAKRLDADTMVWRDGMPDWCAAKLSSLQKVFDAMPSTPPPLIGEEVNNNIAWIIAFAPLISVFIEAFAAATWQVPLLSLWWIAPLLNSALCLADKKHLEMAGQNTEGLTAWAIFLVPVYLFMRADRLSQPATYAWVWLVMFLFMIMPVAVPVALITPRAP